MKYYCQLILLFFLLFFCACSKLDEKIIPSFDIIENSSILSKDFGIENIANIENLECNDSVLVVTDYYKENMFTLFETSTATFKTRFGRMGQGPFELLPGCDGIQIDDEYHVSLKDNGFIARYDIGCLSEIKECPYKLKHNYKIEDGIFSKLLPLVGEQKYYLGAGTYKDRYQYCLFDSLNNVLDFSHIIYNKNNNAMNRFHRYLSNQGILKRKPDENLFVYSLFNSSRLDFLFVSDKHKIQSVKSYHLYNPEYKLWNGGGLNRIFPVENSIVGYLDLSVSSNFVYALFCFKKRYKIENGESCSSDIILVYDWQGKAIKQIKLPFEVFHIAVNETSSEIYGSWQDMDGNWRIATFSL